MLKWKDSMIVAKNVLDAVLRDDRTKDIEGSIEAYQNGREQGYSIVIYNTGFFNKMIAFSENRNSDDIVVYVGEYSFQSISDKAYNNAKYFKWDDIIGAANYIVEQIIDFNK